MNYAKVEFSEIVCGEPDASTSFEVNVVEIPLFHLDNLPCSPKRLIRYLHGHFA